MGLTAFGLDFHTQARRAKSEGASARQNVRATVCALRAAVSGVPLRFQDRLHQPRQPMALEADGNELSNLIMGQVFQIGVFCGLTRPDLVRDVLRQRGRYVSAALTIVRWLVVPSRHASHWPVLVTGPTCVANNCLLLIFHHQS